MGQLLCDIYLFVFLTLFPAGDKVCVIKLRESQVYQGQRLYGHVLGPDCV